MKDLDTMVGALDEILASPREAGRVEMIVVRPDVNERREVSECRLTPEAGVVGDNWRARFENANLEPDPEVQLTLMGSRAIGAVAGDRDQWALAGDQFFVDFDLSEQNLSPGDEIEIGNAVIRVSEEPHTGCSKFAKRYGTDAGRFVNGKERRGLRLRGINASVVTPGTVRVGDAIRKR